MMDALFYFVLAVGIVIIAALFVAWRDAKEESEFAIEQAAIARADAAAGREREAAFAAAIARHQSDREQLAERCEQAVAALAVAHDDVARLNGELFAARNDLAILRDQAQATAYAEHTAEMVQRQRDTDRGNFAFLVGGARRKLVEQHADMLETLDAMVSVYKPAPPVFGPVQKACGCGDDCECSQCLSRHLSQARRD